MEGKNLYPLGTVIVLNGSSKKVMIIGLYPQTKKKEGDSVSHDYIGVMYPEGFISEDMFLVFNHRDISEVIYAGYKGEGEWEDFLRVVEKAMNKEKKKVD